MEFCRSSKDSSLLNMKKFQKTDVYFFVNPKKTLKYILSNVKKDYCQNKKKMIFMYSCELETDEIQESSQ